jgi:diadenylate cyclase
MEQLSDLVEGVQLEPIAVLDIVLTAILIYGAFSLIQGTRAVRLIVGAILLYLLYVMAQVLDLRLLSGIMQIGAVVGLFALVVVFQPELRRGLDRLGRVGSFGWLGLSGSPGQDRVAGVIADTAAALSAARIGGLVVIERETPLGDMAEQGVPLHAHLSTELLTSLFAPGAALHDGAVIVRGETVLAAAVTLPLSEDVPAHGRYGTRHRAALGITEQTDAVAVVVSEERGSIGLAAGGSMTSDIEPERLHARLVELLGPQDGVSDRARRMAERGGRRLRGKPIRGPRRPRNPVSAASPSAGPPTAPAGAPTASVGTPQAASSTRPDRTAPATGARSGE